VHTPAELLVSAQYAPKDLPLWVRFGAGPGLTDGWGTPDFRAFVQLGLAPPVKARPVDTDGDGLMDPDDRCPTEPEDVDQFEDTDGCPDPDNDQDKIPDTIDACPIDPEDKDSFKDEDGCPDAGRSLVVVTANKISILETASPTLEAASVVSTQTPRKMK
jgi:hypothetical protein